MSFHATAAGFSARSNTLSIFRNHLLCSVCATMLLAGSGAVARAEDPVPQPVVKNVTVKSGEIEEFKAGEPIGDIIVNGIATVRGHMRNGTVNNEGNDNHAAAGLLGLLQLSGSSAKATGTIVVGPADGSSLDVLNGATANEVIVNGTQSKTGDQERKGGRAEVLGVGSRIDKSTVNLGGLMMVYDQATAGTVTVNSRGKLEVKAKSKVEEVTVNGEKAWNSLTGLGGIGGFADVYGAGSKIDKGTVNLGGFMKVRDQATAGTITVNSGGWLDVKDGGTAEEVTLNGEKEMDFDGIGSVADVYGAGSKIDKGTVNLGGYMKVRDQATVGTITVNNGGWLAVYDRGTAKEVTLNGEKAWDASGKGGVGSFADVFGVGSRIDKSTVNLGGRMWVRDDASVGTVTVNNGGKLDVLAKGRADNVLVHGGYASTAGHIGTATIDKDGQLDVKAGGKAGTVNLDGGFAFVHDRGEITGKSTVSNGGQLDVWGGSRAGDITLTGGDSAGQKSYAIVEGMAGDITLGANSNLNGFGTVDNVWVHAGGRVAPGTAQYKFAALTTTGDVTFDKGSIYSVQIANDGLRANRLEVQGQANLHGGTVKVQAEDFAGKDSQGAATPQPLSKEQSEGLLSKHFIILTAEKGVIGRFDEIKPDYNYITPTLAYTDKTVSLGFDLTETAKTEQKEKEQKLATELQQQKQAEVDRLKAEQAKVTASARASDEKAQQLADTLKQTQAAFDSLKVEYAKVTAGARASGEKAQQLADTLKQTQAEVDRLKAEQVKVAGDTTAAEAKAQQLAADEAKAQAEADRLNRQLHEEQIKNIVLVDAVTSNQKSTGHAILQLGLGNRLLDTVLLSKKGDVLNYDALSGEAHASLRGTLLQDAGLVSGAANERIRAAFDGVAARPVPVITPLAYGPEDKGKQSAGEAFAAAAPAASTTALWGQAYGGWSHGSSDGNAAAYNRNTGGFVTGMDGLIADTWRLGVLAGYGSTSLHGAGSSTSADSYQLGVYGGTSIDALTLSLGTILAHHDVDTHRRVSFGDIAETDMASYSAKSVHIFGEAAYRIDTAYAAFEPFAAAAYTHLKTDGFSETGGIAALSAPAATADLTTTTLGLRASRAFTLGNATTVTARGMAGWRHAYGDVAPQAQFAFASGGESFAVSGQPMAQDTALIEAGLAYDVGKATTIGLTYTGAFSSQVKDNAVKADLTVRF